MDRLETAYNFIRYMWPKPNFFLLNFARDELASYCYDVSRNLCGRCRRARDFKTLLKRTPPEVLVVEYSAASRELITFKDYIAQKQRKHEK